jgi:hypothetical protein
VRRAGIWFAPLALLVLLTLGGVAARRFWRPAPLHVLFVGNSYTSTNDLPGWVQRLAAADPEAPAIVPESIAPGAMTFADQCTKTGALARIGTGVYARVVLQGQSVEPLSDPASFAESGAKLVAATKQAGATPLLYETWARRSDHALYREVWSGGTPAAMQEGLRDAYARLAADSGARWAPVGEAWQRVLAEDPAIPLFLPDGSHPTEGGTYLAACVLYEALTGRSAVGLEARPASVSAADASVLAEVAHEAVGALASTGTAGVTGPAGR